MDVIQSINGIGIRPGGTGVEVQKGNCSEKLFEKSEIWFAATWIIIYIVVMGNLRNNFGDESLYSILGVLIIAAILTAFIIKTG